MTGIKISGIDQSFLCYDAHLDQFGPQSGGFGSAEQLAGLHLLGGAIRSIFCERDDEPPISASDHLLEAHRIREELMPSHMPFGWHGESRVYYHLEGFESVRSQQNAHWLISELANAIGVRGFTPIYHRNNPLGGCGKESGKGLTKFGRYVLSYAWSQHNWWVDVAHMSDVSICDTLSLREEIDNHIWTPRLAYTHGGIRNIEICDPVIVGGNEERCLGMNRALEIVKAGGLVCLSPVRPFYQRLHGPFVNDIRMLGQASDWRLVGIGTDYGGVHDKWRFPRCETVAKLFEAVIVALLKEGLEEWQVRRVVGENVARFFRLNYSQ